ncbi:MAG: NADPH-dependent assimilatory sulfite reductase hemoprotein subunit [Janthinobacterium lividum]
MSDTTIEAPAARKLSAVEALKEGSHRLRGQLAAELADGGIQVSEDAYNLLKFHGSYEQFDRDSATERKQRGEEKEYQFMVRVRMPGGHLTAAQYLALDALCEARANATLRITTRQGIQFHGVLKGNLKPAIADINHALLSTMNACGDVSRNVMTTPAPRRDVQHRQLEADARMLADALRPRSRAYYEIFLDEAPVAGAGEEEEPLYGSTYLPRKFKIAVIVPSDNTADVLANDLGLIAIYDDEGRGDTLLGYNLALGGGHGMTHNNPRTFPRLATPLAFVTPGNLLRGVEAVIRLQRDHGDRSNRRRARLKYVVADRGVAWVRETLATYYGEALDEARPMPALAVPDLLGWHEQGDGLWWLGVPVPSGRIADHPAAEGGARIRTALREAVERFGTDPTMTPQQDVLLTNIRAEDRAALDALLAGHGVVPASAMTPFEQYALACPALPTCGLALTEAERIRPAMVGALQAALDRHGLGQRRISLRITGCPNGCCRTYAGDIGVVGRMPGFYALWVGGDFAGTRLSFNLLDRVAEDAVVPTLERLFAAYARDGEPDEEFGGFCSRLGQEALLGLVTEKGEAVVA